MLNTKATRRIPGRTKSSKLWTSEIPWSESISNFVRSKFLIFLNRSLAKLTEDEARRIIESEILFSRKKKSLQSNVQILNISNSLVYVVSLGKLWIKFGSLNEKASKNWSLILFAHSHVHRAKTVVLSVPKAPVQASRSFRSSQWCLGDHRSRLRQGEAVCGQSARRLR